MSERKSRHDDIEYKGYTIQNDGHGFYTVFDPRRERIGSCEGSYTAREIAQEHLDRVYRFYNVNCDLSPLQLRAARRLNITQSEFVIEHGYPQVAAFEPDASDIAAMNDRDFR